MQRVILTHVTVIASSQTAPGHASTGTVYWITGLSGSGKTTIGRSLFDKLRARKSAVVFLDGDILREVYGDDLGHSLLERRQLAMRNARLCRMLAQQGLDVVCATISMFHETHAWNRAQIARYREIYLSVPLEVLIARDVKGLYDAALKGDRQQVLGIDLPVEEPRHPDIVIVNDGSETPDQIVERFLDTFEGRAEQ